MEKNKNSVKDNYMARTNADIFRILTVALRDKVKSPSLCDVAILRVEAAADLGTARVFVSGGETELNSMNGVCYGIKGKKTAGTHRRG